MPAAARDAFEIGLVHREAQRLVDLLTDPARTAVNLVTTAEEMPVNETIDDVPQLCATTCTCRPGMLFVNRVHDGGLAAGDVERLERAAARARARSTASAAAARRWRRARARRSAGRRSTRATAPAWPSEVDLPIVELPFLFAEEFGFAELRALAERAGASPRRATRASGAGVKTIAEVVARHQRRHLRRQRRRRQDDDRRGAGGARRASRAGARWC